MRKTCSEPARSLEYTMKPPRCATALCHCAGRKLETVGLVRRSTSSSVDASV
jgi:hypothetical protein